MPRFVSVGECMIEMSGGEDGLYRLGYAGDTLNTAWYARARLGDDWDVDYVTALGDAFIPTGDGAAGTPLSYVRMGETPYTYYVDDSNSGCTAGVNTGGPGGASYQCTCSFVELPK